MKNILYTFLVFGLFFSCNDKKNDLTEANLNGKVKSVYTTSFEAIEKFGEIEKGDKRWQDYDESDNKLIYNDNGNRIEEKNYDEDGELVNEYSYEYKFDDEENWIQKTIFKDDKPTFIIEREIKYYD